MPIENLYIARVTDGLILVASMEAPGTGGSSRGTHAGDKMDLFKNQAKQLLKKLSQQSTARMSIESNPYIFHYVIENGICYMALTDKSYPKRLAFLFLEEISKEFEADLKLDHGDDWQRQVETVGRQYAFIKFDRTIQKRRRECVCAAVYISVCLCVCVSVCLCVCVSIFMRVPLSCTLILTSHYTTLHSLLSTTTTIGTATPHPPPTYVCM